jgi:hypothetical protein
MDERRLAEATGPADAFAALSDGIRVDALRALWDADGALAFSELREAVGVRDSGQFNYHLDKLAGRFVRKTDDGYELTVAGRQVNGAIQAGAYTMEGTIDPIALDEPCPACGGSRTLRYEDEIVRVDCEDCDVAATVGVPPGVFAECDRADVPAVASDYLRTVVQQVTNGFCWYCEGRIAPTVLPVVETADRADPPEAFRDLPTVRFDCDRCGAEIAVDLGMAMSVHPVVVGFLSDHGVDVRDRSVHEFSALDDESARIRERDPFRASVTYDAGGASLTLVVDEDLDVVAVEENESE